MPRLLSNRKPVSRPEDLKENRFEYLNLQQAQPALGLAPEANTGFTLQTDESGRVTFTNTLGKLEFDEQVISGTQAGVDIEINGSVNNGDIVLTPYQSARVAGNFSVEQDAIIDGDFTVRGIPQGTAPLVSNTLYVTPDGNDENDGTSMDSTRACRTISGVVRSPFYQSGTAIKVMAGTYFEDNPIPLKPYTSVVGNDLRTTFVEPLNKDLDLFHVNSGVYIAQMQMRNLRRGAVERYAPGGAGTYTTGAYCCAFPPNLENPIDIYYSPYIQNCTNQSGPWLKDGTMMVPNQTVQIPLAAGTSTWIADQNQITVTLYTGTIAVGMALNDAANEGYRNAQVLLKQNRTFLQSQTVAYVEATFPDLVYNQAKCYRDVGYIVDAVAGDARLGGNKRSIEAGLAYWSGNSSLIANEVTQTVDAINYLKEISLEVITNTTVTNIYSTLSNQVINLNLDKGQVVYTRAASSYDLIKNIIVDGEAAAPDTPTADLLGLIYPTGLSPNNVNVASTVTEITQLTTNTYVITLSTSTVSPSDNATVYFGYTTTYPYLDADIPAIWTADDGDKYVDRRLNPEGSGGGALVDGNAPSLRSPIQSFVFDAFTQLNQGGIGIHIINNGYAQLVSVFTIMCSQAVIVENGGIASITNSNANFGDTCLTAKGLGKLAFQGFVRNPAYPTNVPNGEYYPLGYWPQKQIMEVFIPNDRDRPHIGQVMEVVPPDTYINYEGNRVPYVNEAGYPGYLAVTSNTSTITTGSYTINDIDVTSIAVGHTLYVRDVLGMETHPVTGQPYITTGTQVVDVNYRSITLDTPILTGYTDLANANYFNLYFCGNAYYTVLSSSIDTSLSSTVTTEVTLVPGQETTTSLAISYAKKLALKIIQNEEITGLVYNQAKCKRDTGLIVDALALDLLYPTPELSQSNFAGLQYWNQENYINEITDEITTTTNAIRYVQELTREIVQGITTGTRYQSTVSQNVVGDLATAVEAGIVSDDFEVIIDIIIDGIAGVSDRIVPNGDQSTATNIVNAYSLLVANRSYIQTEAVAFVEYTKAPGFTYDSVKCYRDVGYMVDSVAFDLIHPNGNQASNRQAIQSGVYYYGYNASSTAIEGEIPQTTAAYNYIKQLMPFVLKGVTTSTYQTYLDQVTNLDAATDTEVLAVETLIDHITNIINSGPSVAEIKVPISLTESVDPNVYNAYRLLNANRAFIQEEVIAYINETYEAGTYQSEYQQIFDASLTGGIDAVPSLGEKFDIISDIIINGADSSPAIQRPRQYVDTNQNILNAKKLLDKNRLFIQNETVAFVDSIWPSKFSYDPAKCSRDTGLIVDSLAQDLLFNGTSQSTFAGIQYWNQGLTVIPGEQTTTTNAVKYLKLLAQKVVTNTTSTYNYQSTVTQVVSTITSSTSLISAVIGTNFNVIVDILDNGTDGITDRIVPNSLSASTASARLAAYDLLQQNRNYLQHETVAWVEANANFVYNSVKCARDTGLIVDSIALDLLYPTATDSQSNFAGLQYWNQSNYVGSIAEEITTTTNAITHISSIAQKVVVGDLSGTRYQSTVTQTTSTASGGILDAVAVGTDFGVILNILSTGTAGVTDIIVPNGRRSITTSTVNAYNLLIANKSYLVAEAIAYVEDTKTAEFEYDQTKCARDVGYMVDSVAFDLLHGGNKQAVQSGVLYYGYDSTSTAVPNEIPQTTAAYNRIKEILPSILTGVTITPSLGNSTNQITYMLPTSSAQIAAAQAKVNKITNIINNGPAAASELFPISLTPSTDTNADRAYDLLVANREFIKDEIIAYIDSTFTGFVYDKDKCFRDVGYMIDSVSFDVLYGGNKQSVQSGVYYYGYLEDSTAIPNEIPQTTSAYNFIEQIVSDIVTGTLITNPQQAAVPQVTNLSFTYNQGKCTRDTGILVDSFITDILFAENGYTQSNFSGLQYWNQNGYTGSIASEITTTTNAIRYLRSLAEQVVINETSTATVVRFTTTASQITNLTTATYDQLYSVRRDFNVIVDVLTTGTSGITDKVIANGIEPVSNDAVNAYELLIANKEYLQQQVVAYVESTKTSGFVYDMSKCYRDVGYMVDSVAFDIKYGGNRQAIQSGVYYYGFSTSTSAIAGEIEQTIAAYTRLREILPDIVANAPITKSPNNTLTQVTSLTTATSAEGIELENMVDLITDIITTGPSVAEAQLPIGLTRSTATSVVAAAEILAANRTFIVEEVINYLNYVHLVGTETQAQSVKNNVNLINNIIEYGPDEVLAKEPIALTRSTSTSVINAANLLNANRDFIRAETIAFINNEYNTGFLYDKTKCRRDTGLIVDSIAFDLLYEGTTESTFAGLQYWNQDTYVGTIRGEITTTTNAIRYLKQVVGDIVLNNTVVATTGNNTVQVTNLPSSTEGIAGVLTGNVDVILNILSNGTGGVTDIIVPNGVVQTSTDIVTAIDLLEANANFIKDEVIARIDLDNTEFEYDRTKCRRDIGYIVDSISFDLQHGGNRQSVTSGVYYYGFNAADTAIDDQIPQTTAAYNYIRELVDKIIQSTAIPVTYQKKVPQVLSSAVGTPAEVSLVQAKIDNITNIIENGPDVAPTQEPISAVASTSTAVVNSFSILLANRAFVQAEVVAYIDAVFTDATNYDRAKCFRDTGAIVDAVGYDLIYGGNYNSVNTGNGYFLRKGQYHLVRLEQNVTDPTLFIDGASVRFYQQSYISASGYLFEYVGAGTQYGALPQVGTADPQQSKEVVQLNNGKVFFTSTDQNGDFRIGPTLVISQSTGVLSGRTFQKSLYAEMTPFILVVGA
jgi:hypothetical protein